MSQAMPIWPGVAPGSPPTPYQPTRFANEILSEPGDHPTLTPYLLADGQTHALVIVAPGGGYGCQAAHEGEPVAQMLNRAGLHAAVLRYRVGPRHQHPAMLNDLQRAVRLTRAHAEAWKVARHASGRAFVGVLGFSAGGHLAASLAVHFDRFTCPQDDLAAEHSARPDAVALGYPVIDLTEFRHHGSLRNLLGPTPDPAMVEMMSCHKQVRGDSPPAFLWHTADDGGVPVQNSILYFQACLAQQVRAELHVYETGHHGMGLAEKHPTIRSWADLVGDFFRRHLSA